VPRWVTVFGRVNTTSARNHAPRPTQPEPVLCAQAGMSTWRKLGGQTGISRDIPARICGLAGFAECLAGGWLAEISADLREAEAVAHLRLVSDDALYKSTVYLLPKIVISNTSSSAVYHAQGSVLGPILFAVRRRSIVVDQRLWSSLSSLC